MSITEFVDKLDAGARRWADLAIAALAAAVLALLVWYGMGIVRATWDNELTVLGWPMGLQYLALPVGAAATRVRRVGPCDLPERVADRYRVRCSRS